MEVHAIQGDSGSTGLFGRRAIGLVEHVGHDGFAPALFELAHETTGCKHLTAFSFDGDRSARVVFAENTGAAGVASSLAQKYVTSYWRLDPANTVLPTAEEDSRCWGVNSSASDITDSVYRSQCYSAVGLEHRLSVSQRCGGRTYRLNFYSGKGRIFSAEAATRILQAANLLLALTRRHDLDAGLGTVEWFAQRLRNVAPVLSGRELQVTSLIANGLSSQGIALELGIGINTVLTYRRRAYARLNISTQNELMQLLLGTLSPNRRVPVSSALVTAKRPRVV
jgi:DNA-binding CsgD family transcriptional regulator